MGKRYTQTINSFNGQISNDIRSKDFRNFNFASHFDTYTYPHKLFPRYGADTKEGGNVFGTVVVKPYRFLYDQRGANGYALFSLAEITGGRPVILYYDTDLSEWVTPTSGLGGEGTAVDKDCFFSYKGYAYMWDSGTLMRYKLDASEAFNDSFKTVTPATVFRCCQPVIHPEDNQAYFFADSKIYSLTSGDVWTQSTTVLPDNSYITSACVYQQYIVLAVNYLGGKRTSILFWDRDTGLASVSYRYDINNEETYKISVVNGRIMLVTSGGYSINVRRYNGVEFEKISSLVSDDESITVSVADLQQEAIVFEDKMYFSLDYTTPNEENRLGIWALDINGKLSLDTVINGATSYQGFLYLSGLLWIAYNNAHVVRTNLTFSADVSSVYETLMVGDIKDNKKLIKVGVSTEPLPTAGQIILKYRVKETDNWTTIFTNTTDGSSYHDAINIESTGITFNESREYQFRIESLGGAVPVSIDIEYEIINSNLS